MVVLDTSSILDIDSTGLQQVELLVNELRNDNISLAITNCIGPVRDFLKKSGLSDLIGDDNQFLTNVDAVDAFFARHSSTTDSNEFAAQHNLKIKGK